MCLMPPHAERGGMRYSRLSAVVGLKRPRGARCANLVRNDPGAAASMPRAARAPSSGARFCRPAAGPRAAGGIRGRGGRACGGDNPLSPRAPGGLSATAGPRAWTPPGRSPAHPRPGSAAFPAAGSASPLGHGSRPLVQLSKQGVSLSFWLTKSQRGTGGLNACVWTQAIIPNYSFSFEPARPAGELAAERAP